VEVSNFNVRLYNAKFSKYIDKLKNNGKFRLYNLCYISLHVNVRKLTQKERIEHGYFILDE